MNGFFFICFELSSILKSGLKLIQKIPILFVSDTVDMGYLNVVENYSKSFSRLFRLSSCHHISDSASIFVA
jgi:hypothetical protein